MPAPSRPARIIQAGVGVGLILSGLGNFGIIRGWGDGHTGFGIAIGALFLTAGACLLALSARNRPPPGRE
jgi:hypothetical protein